MTRPKLSQKPSRRWSRRKKKMGLCTLCGKPRSKYKHLCDFHQGQATAYMKRWRKAKKARLAAEQAAAEELAHLQSQTGTGRSDLQEGD